jgi:hypothetical protein
VGAEGDALRRQAGAARALGQRAAAVSRGTGELRQHLGRIGAGIGGVIAGTASGEDHRLRHLIDKAERSQRASGDAVRDVASAAEQMANRLEAQARAADAREEAERAAERKKT